jgi:hypothetical protein
MDFGCVHPATSLVAIAMAKFSHNINTNKMEELVFNSGSEE